MASVNIAEIEIPTLKIEGGKEPYSIPLGGAIPPKRLEKIRTLDDILDFLKEHIPAEVVDMYSAIQIKQIFEAWSEATKEEYDLTPGELSASHGSAKKTARR